MVQPDRSRATNQASTLRETLKLLNRYRELTWQLAKREWSERHSGQWLGTFWVVAHPLVTMSVYVFIFAWVLKIRMGQSHALPGDYATYILSGLIPWMSFQDSMNKGCTYITGNIRLVKQVVFPVEILPVKGVFTSFVNQLIATTLLVGYMVASQGTLSWTILLLPILFLFQLLAMVGVGYFLSSVTVYFRDLTDVVRIFSFIGVFLMPLFYLPAWIPALFQVVIYLNPFSYLIWCYQDALYFGHLEHWWAWCLFPLMSVATLYFGFRTFKTLKVMFGSVL